MTHYIVFASLGLVIVIGVAMVALLKPAAPVGSFNEQVG